MATNSGKALVSDHCFSAGAVCTALDKALNSPAEKPARLDGDPDKAFKNAAKVIEKVYNAPFLPHNTMEPMNFFAHVTEDHAELLGPTQTPEWMEPAIAELLGLPLEKIDINMTRQGGGFGRRLYGHFMIEAAAISQKAKAPVKLVYSIFNAFFACITSQVLSPTTATRVLKAVW